MENDLPSSKQCSSGTLRQQQRPRDVPPPPPPPPPPKPIPVSLTIKKNCIPSNKLDTPNVLRNFYTPQNNHYQKPPAGNCVRRFDSTENFRNGYNSSTNGTTGTLNLIIHKYCYYFPSYHYR